MYIKIRFDSPLELEERPEPFSFGKNHRSTTSYIHGFFSLYLIRRVKSSIVSSEKELLNKEMEKLKVIRASVKKYFNIVDKNERDIRAKISRMKIDYIKETDISKAIEK